MIPFLLDYLRANFDTLFPGRKAPPAFVPIKAPGKRGARSKVNVLVFGGHSDGMLAVCSFPRSPEFDECITLEADNLRRCRDALKDRPVAGTLPEILFDGEIEGVHVLIQEGKPGISLQEILASGRSYRKWFMLCGAWLADLHASTTVARVKVAKEDLDAWLFRPLDTLIQGSVFLNADRVKKIRQWIDSAARFVEGQEVPLCGQHGDFNAHNILVHEQGIAVIDWEDARFDVPPFLDLNQFVISNAHQLKTGLTPAESMQRFALSRGAYRDAVHEMSTAYCRAIEIHPSFPMMMVPACMVHMACMYRMAHRGQEKASKDWLEMLDCFVTQCSAGECW